MGQKLLGETEVVGKGNLQIQSFLPWESVLVSARIDLIFSLIAGTGLYFGFRVEMMLKTH